MASGISAQARLELLQALRERYREAGRVAKGRILDEFVAVTKCHRKHAVRLLGRPDEESTVVGTAVGRPVYGEAVREAPAVAWHAPTDNPRGMGRAVRGGGEARTTVEAG